MISGNVRSPVAPARSPNSDPGFLESGDAATSSTDFASALADQLKPGSPRGMAPGASDHAAAEPQPQPDRESTSRDALYLKENDSTREPLPSPTTESAPSRAGELAASRRSAKPAALRELAKPGRPTPQKELAETTTSAEETKADSTSTSTISAQIGAERGTEVLMTSTCAWLLLPPLEEVPVPLVSSLEEELLGVNGQAMEFLGEEGGGDVVASETGDSTSGAETPGRNVPPLTTHSADSSSSSVADSGVKITPAEGKPQKNGEKPYFSSISTISQADDSAPKNAGTAAAKPDLDMSKKTELDMLNSPFAEELTPIQELHRIPVQWHAVEANPADAVAATLKPEMAQVVENAVPTSQTHLGVVDQTHTIERIEKLMLNEVVVMRQSRPESLSVVLEPDKHTRLFVQMSTQDGAIQASVRCEAGDATRLQTHWKELQQSLAREGVELRDLEFSPEQRSSANLNFSGNQQKSQRDFTAEADRIVVAEAPRKAGKPVPMARRADDMSRQLLEFWA